MARRDTVENGCPLDILAFHDFNGVFFHDGAQANVFDLLFSYNLLVDHVRYAARLEALRTGTAFGVTWVRQDGGDWDLAAPAGARTDLRASMRLRLARLDHLFYGETLRPPLFLRHGWEGRGTRGEPPVPIDHAGFGWLLHPPAASGAYADLSKRGQRIPPGATDLPSGGPFTFDHAAAGSWVPGDGEV
jgi:hypothetical protein